MFTFKLRQLVQLKLSSEQGEIVARMESVSSSPMYQIQYKDGTGCQKKEWFDEEAIVAL